MARIEGLEARRLFAILQPDVTWGDDGFVDRQAEHSFLAATGAGVVTQDDFIDDSPTGLITRFTPDGDADRTFHDIRPAEGFYAAVDARGRIYVMTHEADKVSLARYAADGTPDAAWGANGIVAIDLDDSNIGYDVTLDRVAVLADGSVYPTLSYNSRFYDDEGGTFIGGDHTVVFKFDDAGRADLAFGDDGHLGFYAGDSEDNSDFFVWTGVQPDGRVIFFQNDPYGSAFITRYNADGSRDETYGTYTDNESPAIESSVDVENIALDAQGRLIVAEQFFDFGDGLDEDTTYALKVHRFTVDGLPDAAFGDNGVYTLPGEPEYGDSAGAVLPQKNGKLIVRLGDKVLRLTADGRPDSTFAPGGAFDIEYPSQQIVGQLPDGSLLTYEPARDDGESNYSIAKLAPRRTVAQGRSGTLYLNGTEGRDDVRLEPTSTAGRAAVDVGGARAGTFSNVTAVVVDLGAGSDVYVDTFLADTSVPQTVLGGAGNDSIVTGGGDDFIIGEDGDDTVQSGGGYDRIEGGDGAADVDAGPGGGELTFTPGKDDRIVVRGTGGRWKVRASGGRADVLLSGDTAEVDFSSTRAGVFVLDMTNGATLFAGDGNDSITTGDGPDLIVPGYGDDTVASGAGDDVVAGEEDRFGDPAPTQNDTYDLGPGDDTARDAYGNNSITGGDGDDSIRTGPGDDRLNGGLGRDTLRGGDGNDELLGGGGRDRLYGSIGNDELRGGGNNDTLVAGAGDDTLYGGAGDDLLLAGTPGVRGKSTRNVLGGGAGTDRYATESDDDVIDLVEERYE